MGGLFLGTGPVDDSDMEDSVVHSDTATSILEMMMMTMISVLLRQIRMTRRMTQHKWMRVSQTFRLSLPV
jgi:hypothetical protein